jgi:hypothetical protein
MSQPVLDRPIEDADEVGLRRPTKRLGRNTAFCLGRNKGCCRKLNGNVPGGRTAEGMPPLVAQIFNLLYRRFVIGRATDILSRVGPECVQQNAILR